jgi:general secretion pathway protein K
MNRRHRAFARRWSRQRSVALLAAVLLVALATVLATRIGTRGAIDQRRAAAQMVREQAFGIALGAEAWAAEILREDMQRGQTEDSLTETWAMPLPPLPIEGGSVEGGMEDAQGRFNLNNLVTASGQPDLYVLAHFQRLLTALDLEPKWAQILVDWMDPDSIRGFPDGAEDGEYLAGQPPYRAANTYLTSTSELLALPDFGIERYRKLAPYVVALPHGVKLNVCTASGVVIDTLAPAFREFSADAQQLAKNRQKGCFPTVADLSAAFPPEAWAEAGSHVEQRSSWFRLTTRVTLGGTEVTLYSLLERNGVGGSRATLRTFGTD